MRMKKEASTSSRDLANLQYLSMRRMGMDTRWIELETNLRKSGSSWAMAQTLSDHPDICNVEFDGKIYESTSIGQAEIVLASILKNRKDEGAPTSPLDSGLTPSQSDAARALLQHDTAILTGGPGTGKTFTTRAICESLRSEGRSVITCAFTGVAARRIGESTGFPGCTIHRLLRHDGNRFTEKEIPYDALVIDEGGMISAGLFCSVLSRVKAGTKVYIVGDENQLPSVEPGNSFYSMQSFLPTFRLTEVIRQGKGSAVSRQAMRVLSGHVPCEYRNDNGVGGLFLSACRGVSNLAEKNNPRRVAEFIANMDKSRLCDIRIMCGTNSLVDSINYMYRENAHVPFQNTKNRRCGTLFNGDFAIKESVHHSMGELDDGRLERIDKLWRLAWATTVHKMQGNECTSAIVIPEWNMTRQSLYTAITRARVRIGIVGNHSHLAKIVNRNEAHRLCLVAALYSGMAKVIKETQKSEQI